MELGECEWALPPEQCLATAAEVHVWRCDLNRAGPSGLEFHDLLTAAERARAGRLVQAADRRHWIAARGWLRWILARYLPPAAAEFEFASNAYGRPELAGPTATHGVRFNQSHSHGLTLIAVTRHRELGVDLEAIRADVSALEIAERFFAAGEVARLRALPAAAQVPAFFRCWTGKEAFIKAQGQGLSYPLNEFEVAVAPEDPPGLLAMHRDATAASRWRVQPLSVHPAFAAALVVEGHDWRLRCWDPGAG